MTDSFEQGTSNECVRSDTEPPVYNVRTEIVSKHISVPLSSSKHTYASFIERFRDEIQRSINPDELIPHMLEHDLLQTVDDVGPLHLTPRNEKVKFVLSALKETDHSVFKKCLEGTTSHMGHIYILSLLNNVPDESQDRNKPVSNNRKRKHSNTSCTVTKRLPDRLQLQDELKSPFYFDNVKRIRRLHLLGKWEEADEIAEVCTRSATIEVRIAIMLECCTGLITRKQKDQVLSKVEEAQQQCSNLQTESSTALEGRCLWVLAKLHRYMGDMALAKERIRDARDVCFNLAAGEDTALISYCSACILLESNANQTSLETVRKVKKDLSCAIDHARSGDYGLSLDHPQIRLAQVYLGSSPLIPGRNADSESIDKASALLKQVNMESLAKRTLCIFRYTESDLYRNKNNVSKALECAQNAMELATANGFMTEITSINVRLASLTELSQASEQSS